MQAAASSSAASITSSAYLGLRGFVEHSTQFSAAERYLAVDLQQRLPGQYSLHQRVFGQLAERQAKGQPVSDKV